MKLVNWTMNGRADFGVVTAGGPTDGDGCRCSMPG